MPIKPNEASPRTSTIPYTPTSPGWPSVHPRALGPIHPHPRIDRVRTPTLPSHPRPPVFHTTPHGTYRLSTHLVPAAFPRLAPDMPLPEIPPYTPGDSERRDRLAVLATQIIEAQRVHEENRVGGRPGERLLWNCVNRYVRTSGRSTTGGVGVTLLLSHANGFHKETWETMLRHLLDAPAGEMVDEVWAWDAVQHGDAAVVNAESLSAIFDWLDNTRDIANFLLHYLPEDVEATALPTRLSRLPVSVTKVRKEHGYRTRTLVVVGHSFGGCTSLRVALDFPKLFSAFVLVDPVISRPRTYRPSNLHQTVLGALTRRDRWSSREEARRLFQKSPFFGAWNPEVLQLYLDHGLVGDSERGVRLKMTGFQEGITFANQLASYEMWELLERLDEGIALRWLIPEQRESARRQIYERVWRRPANSTNVVFHFCGHLIVQEAPLELAHDVSDFLLCKYGCTRPRL